MTTKKTVVVSARVPVEVASALVDDARQLGLEPGTVIRNLLEGRYSPDKIAGKSYGSAAKSRDSLDEVRLEGE